MVMTVLVGDAKVKLQGDPCFTLGKRLLVQELLYADDTLVVDAEIGVVKAYMDYINTAGEQYGLQFNWSKLEVLPARCSATLPMPDGKFVKQKESMKYLGSILAADGGISSERGARLGAARADYDKLARIWSHASISRHRKLQIFEACVISKLLYCIHVACLNVAELRKLDAFYVRCLRRIAGIQPSYYSRVSNQTVLETMKRKPLSTALERRQLLYIRHLAQLPDGNVLRDCVFENSTFTLRRHQGPRKRGRPRVTWGESIYNLAVSVAGGQHNFQRLWASTPEAAMAWRATVDQYYVHK